MPRNWKLGTSSKKKTRCYFWRGGCEYQARKKPTLLNHMKEAHDYDHAALDSVAMNKFWQEYYGFK